MAGMSGRAADFPSNATAVIVVRSTEVGAQDTKETVSTLEECRHLTDTSNYMKRTSVSQFC
jgi:hypothetical protein